MDFSAFGPHGCVLILAFGEDNMTDIKSNKIVKCACQKSQRSSHKTRSQYIPPGVYYLSYICAVHSPCSLLRVSARRPSLKDISHYRNDALAAAAS